MLTKPLAKFHVGILTVSDSVYAQQAVDETGPAIAALLGESNGETNQWFVAARSCVPDDLDQIQGTIKLWTGHRKLDMVLTLGGTGFGHRDVTPEAVGQLLIKHAPGLSLVMLQAAIGATPFAALTRPVCGIRGNTVVITLPASVKSAIENLSAILPILPQALELIRGGGSHASHESIHTSPAFGPMTTPPATVTYANLRSNTHGLRTQSGAGGGGGSNPGVSLPRPVSPVPHATTMTHVTRPLDAPVASRPRLSPFPLTPIDDAFSLITAYAKRLSPITVTLSSSLVGAVVAEDVHAREDVPSYRASAVDGYAVNAIDGIGTFPVTEQASLAGSEPGPVPAKHILRIATGGPLPPTVNAVVPMEQTKLIRASADGHAEELVELLRGVKPSENVREIGSDVRSGEMILRAGQLITEVGGEIGLLASCGINQISVYRRPVVGVMSTGNEVVDINSSNVLHPGQIHDTNRPSLLAAARAAGFECVDLGVVHDTPESLEAGLRSSLERVDVLVTTGGVSMGEADMLKGVLERRLRATIHFGRVLMKPGKPTTFASVPSRIPGDPDKLVFALPGNPVSALVTFHLFTLAALRRMGGHPKPDLARIKVQLTHDIQLDPRPEYQRAIVQVREDGHGLLATSTGEQRSSRIASVRSANALLQLPLGGENGRKSLSRGDVVEALLIGRL